MLVLLWQDTPVMLSLYDPDDQRGALHEGTRGAQRGTRQGLLARMKDET